MALHDPEERRGIDETTGTMLTTHARSAQACRVRSPVSWTNTSPMIRASRLRWFFVGLGLEVEGRMADVVAKWFQAEEWRGKRKSEQLWNRQERKMTRAPMDVD